MHEGAAPSDSYQNKVCREEDNGELIGRAGLGKKSHQEDVLQQAIEKEKKEMKKRKIENLLSFCGQLQMREGMRSVVLVVVGGSIQ